MSRCGIPTEGTPTPHDQALQQDPPDPTPVGALGTIVFPLYLASSRSDVRWTLRRTTGAGNLIAVSKEEIDVLIRAATALLALAALLVSILAFRRGGPKLSVTATRTTVLFDEPPDSRYMVFVQVKNDGGASAQVGRVLLRNTDGNETFHFSKSTGVGPSLPHTLESHGGIANWMFDYNELQQSYVRAPRDDELVLRAHVVVGSRTYRAPTRIVVVPPGVYSRAQSLRERLSLRPRVQFDSWFAPGDIDLDGGTVTLTASNYGRWWSKPFTVTLLSESEDPFHRTPVPGVPKIRFPRIAPRRDHKTRVSLLEDPSEGTVLRWAVTSGPGLGSGPAAMTWAHARDIAAEHALWKAWRSKVTDISTGTKPGTPIEESPKV